MIKIYYIDISSDQTLLDFEMYIKLLIQTFTPSETHILFTNETHYHNQNSNIAYQQEQWILQESKIKSLNYIILKHNIARILQDCNSTEVQIESPLKNLAKTNLKVTLNALNHINNDVSLLSNLYLMLHYSDQKYHFDGKLAEPIEFNYGIMSEHVHTLHLFFSEFHPENGYLTRILIPNITLIFHTFKKEKKYKISSLPEIIGRGQSNKNYIAFLAYFTSEIRGSYNNGITQFLDVNKQIFIEHYQNIAVEKKRSWDIFFSTNELNQALEEQNLLPVTKSPRYSDSASIEDSELDISKISDISFPISIHDKQNIKKLGKAYNFIYLFNDKSESNCYNLIIAPVAQLPCEKRNLGVFAEKTIKAHTHLSYYLGEKGLLENIEDQTYTFMINDNEGIDARHKRNWTAFINSSSNPIECNIIMYQSKNSIIVKTSKKIEAGEQLITDYSKEYLFEKDNYKRFLNRSDNSLDSADLLKKYQNFYTDEPKCLESEYANLFMVSSKTYFKIPNFDQCMLHNSSNAHKISANILNNLNVNLPLLVIENNLPLKQKWQENITILMYACITNNQELIMYLLENNANTNRQSSIQGYTTLHLALRSSLTLVDKKSIIEKLIHHGAILHLCDINGQSVVHEAIKTQKFELLEYIFKKFFDKHNSYKKKLFKEIMDTMNNEGLDPFLYSMACKQNEMSDFLANYFSSEIINSYSKHKDKYALFNQYLMKLPKDNHKNNIFNTLEKIVKNNILTKKSGFFNSKKEKIVMNDLNKESSYKVCK